MRIANEEMKGMHINVRATTGAQIMRKKPLRPQRVQIRSLQIPTRGWAIKPKAGLIANMRNMYWGLFVKSLIVRGNT
jgi:hypothetical protein